MLFTALAVLLAIAVDDANRTVVVLGAVVGVLASVVQFLGLIRWPFPVPYLAQVAREAEPDSAAGQAVDVVFQSFNRYLGVAVESTLAMHSPASGRSSPESRSSIRASRPTGSASGVLIGPLFLICSLEFVGRVDDTGWKVAELLTPVTYVVWSLWLIAVGVGLLV